MAAVTKQALVLLTQEDEIKLAQALVAKFPEVKFLDFQKWSDADAPPVCESVTDCGPTISIWNPLIYPILPTGSRSNGKISGPQIGPVIQWLRSREVRSGELQSGRLAASYSESTPAQMVDFVQSIWRILFRETSNKLVRVSLNADGVNVLAEERRFRVGAHAQEDALAGSLMLVSAQMKLMPETQK